MSSAGTGAGHVALVTGASRGIGAAIARAVAARGAAVLLTAREAESCEPVAAELRGAGGRAECLALDVADEGSLAAALARVTELEAQWGPVDWLVNNAGIAESAPFAGPEVEALVRRQMEVNFHGARRLAEALVPGMKERGYGRVVNVASSAGLRGYAYVSAYCASKFALVGWTLAAAAELAGSGVALGAVCPHYVDTPMLARSVERLVEKTGRSEEDARRFFAGENPGGRLVSSEEVAEAVCGLLEDEGTGLLVELDGSDAAQVHRPDGEVARG